MCIHLKFNYRKATQSLVFFAQQSGGTIDKLKALKLVYLADRYHLRKYGRPITNDEYFAMPYGPVASGVKDIAEFSDFLGEKERTYAAQYLTKAKGHYIGTTQPLQGDALSESEIEALSFAWETFGHYAQFELSEITHKYPEWKKHEQNLQSYTRLKMNLEDFLDDPTEPGVEKCFELSVEDKQDTLDELQELSRLEDLWN